MKTVMDDFSGKVWGKRNENIGGFYVFEMMCNSGSIPLERCHEHKMKRGFKNLKQRDGPRWDLEIHLVIKLVTHYTLEAFAMLGSRQNQCQAQIVVATIFLIQVPSESNWENWQKPKNFYDMRQNYFTVRKDQKRKKVIEAVKNKLEILGELKTAADK